MKLSADYTDILQKLTDAQGLAGKAIAFGLYDTAAAVAQACREEAAGLSFKDAQEGTVSAIAESIGIATFRDTGDGKQTSISADGYFPGGFPIAFFVRTLENGTSRIPANPFMQRAAARSIAHAEATGQATAEGIINEALK